MVKKIFTSKASGSSVDEIVGWKQPVFHQKSECYVSVSVFDPARGQFRTKKIMLGHVKGKKAQRMYAEALIKRLTEKLLRGWNPWVERSSPKEYSTFDEVCEKYHEYIMKMLQEGSMRQESVTSYLSRLKILKDWVRKEGIQLHYIYQFDKHVVSDFLDYIFIDRNNTVQTRNNYLTWVKSFSKYLTERGYVPSDPSACFSGIRPRKGGKGRSVIPDHVLEQLRNFLVMYNKHFLLACYILHYMFVRPHEMSFLRVGDFSVARKTLLLHGDHTKNREDAVVTIPDHVMRLIIDLKVLNAPNHYYLFSDDFRPGRERRSEKCFRDFWNYHVRKALKLPAQYKFYSLKDTGITNMLKANTDIISVRDQARHSSILITDIYTPKDIQAANELIVNYKGIL